MGSFKKVDTRTAQHPRVREARLRRNRAAVEAERARLRAEHKRKEAVLMAGIGALGSAAAGEFLARRLEEDEERVALASLRALSESSEG